VGLRLNATRVGEATVAYAGFDRAVQVITAEAEKYHVHLPISGSAACRSGAAGARRWHAASRGRIHAGRVRRHRLARRP
jgi:hypothetical protein